MVTVRGIYENGKVELLQQVNTSNRQQVLVTFVDDANDDEEIRLLSLQNPTQILKDYLADGAEDLYQDYLKK